MSQQPILYSFRRCPYAMRARLAIAASGFSVRLREIILRDKPPHMLEISPKGTVPVLQLTDGRVIDESLSIMRHVLERDDPDQWLVGEDGGWQALIDQNDGPFKHHLDRYKYAVRYEGANSLESRDAGAAILRQLNERLENQRFLCGDQPKLVDMAIFPFIRQFRIADPDWFDAQPWCPLKEWLEAHCMSALFSSVMKKYSLYLSAGEEQPFPA